MRLVSVEQMERVMFVGNAVPGMVYIGSNYLALVLYLPLFFLRESRIEDATACRKCSRSELMERVM